MERKYLGAEIKKLGFGLMRLPQLPDGETDIGQVKEMADRFLAKGFTYFDTAYVYGAGGASERAFRAAVAERYPREAYQIADKLPLWEAKSKGELMPLFETSRSRAGVDYFDFYLLHNISDARIEGSEQIGAWEFLRELKERSLVRHIGFSSHANAAQIDGILTRHPEAEFVQIQLSYADWENKTVQARRCYETVRRHGKPVIVMEPVKGGFLAELPPEAERPLRALRPEMSSASWAIRFAASLDGIVTVLSGMSTLEQMEDNLSYMEEFQPLSAAERDALEKALAVLNGRDIIPCTNCQYCVENCPSRIHIPGLLRLLNEYRTFGLIPGLKHRYWMETGFRDVGGRASTCVSCRSCEEYCPQHIEICGLIAEIAKIFD